MSFLYWGLIKPNDVKRERSSWDLTEISSGSCSGFLRVRSVSDVYSELCGEFKSEVDRH